MKDKYIIHVFRSSFGSASSLIRFASSSSVRLVMSAQGKRRRAPASKAGGQEKKLKLTADDEAPVTFRRGSGQGINSGSSLKERYCASASGDAAPSKSHVQVDMHNKNKESSNLQCKIDFQRLSHLIDI